MLKGTLSRLRKLLIAVLLGTFLVFWLGHLSSNPGFAAPEELSYDDGSPEFGFRAGADVMAAVLFDAPSRVFIKKLRFFVNGEAEPVRVYVLDSMQRPIYSKEVLYPGGKGWFDVDVSGASIFVEGRFYVGWMWLSGRQCPPCSWLNVDKNGPPHYRSYLGTGTLRLVKDVPEGSGFRQENYMIRVLVDTSLSSSQDSTFTGVILINRPIISFYSIDIRITGVLSDPSGRLKPGGIVTVWGHRGSPARVDDAAPGDLVEVRGTFRGSDTRGGILGTYVDLSEARHYIKRSAQPGNLVHFDIDYRGTPPNSDGNDQHSVTALPGTSLTMFFRYNEGTAGNQYIIRVYPEWDKNRYIANSDNNEAPYGEVGQEIGGWRWDREAYTVPPTPGTYKIRVVYSAGPIPPTWDRYDRLLAEATVIVSKPAIIETSLTIDLDPPTISGGSPLPWVIRIGGRLTRKDTGAGIGGKPVNLFFWLYLGTKSVVTDRNGYYSIEVKLDQALNPGLYDFRAEFAGDREYGFSSATVTLAVVQPRKRHNEPPNVLIDLGHEFTFMCDAFLPNAYLLPYGYEVTRSFAFLHPAMLNGVDVLVIHQATTAVPFTSEQIAAIQEFVRNGGGLLLIGNKSVWKSSPFFPDVKGYPLNDLSEAFGVTFGDGHGTPPFRTHPHEITQGVTIVDNQGLLSGLLKVDKTSTVIVTDSTGRPVCAVKEFGSGRVVTIAMDCFISSPYSGKPLVNVGFIQQMFKWLSFGKTTRWSNHTPPSRILPERRLVQGNVTLYYSEALGRRATFLLEIFPTVYNSLARMMGLEPVGQFTVIALATGGGGYSGGQELGIGVLAKDSAVVMVLAHELTHSFVLPGALPGFGFNEGWASLAAIRVARQLGYGADADAERRQFESQFRSLDFDGTRLDLNTLVVPEDHAQAYMGKAMWVIESLEKNYGADFMARLMPLHRQWVQSGRASNPVTMRDFIGMLSMVAGTDLASFFKAIGTHW